MASGNVFLVQYYYDAAWHDVLCCTSDDLTISNGSIDISSNTDKGHVIRLPGYNLSLSFTGQAYHDAEVSAAGGKSDRYASYYFGNIDWSSTDTRYSFRIISGLGYSYQCEGYLTAYNIENSIGAAQGLSVSFSSHGPITYSTGL